MKHKGSDKHLTKGRGKYKTENQEEQYPIPYDELLLQFMRMMPNQKDIESSSENPTEKNNDVWDWLDPSDNEKKEKNEKDTEDNPEITK